MGKQQSKYKGGSIEQNEILSKIKTIGFEFETNQMTHFSIRGDELLDIEKNKLGNYPKGVITLAQLKSILENKLSISIP